MAPRRSLFRSPYGCQKPPLGSTLDRSHRLAQGVEALFLLNEGSGSLVRYSTNAINEPISTATPLTAMASSVVWGHGRDGPGLVFPGTDAGVTFDASGLSANTTNYTIECWFHINSTSLSGTFVKCGGAGNGYAIGVGNGTHDSDGNELIGLLEGVAWLDTNTAIGLGWHHCAMVGNASGQPTIYFNGREVFSSASVTLTTFGDRRLGYSVNANRGFAGALSKATVYRRALVLDEIEELYLEPFGMVVPPEPWRRFWVFDAASARLRTLMGVGQ